MTSQIERIIQENERKETMPDRYYDRPEHHGRTLTATEEERERRMRAAMRNLARGR